MRKPHIVRTNAKGHFIVKNIEMLARGASKVLIIDFWIADEASPRGSESPDLLPCGTNSPLSGCLCLPRLLFNGTLKTELRHRKTMLGSLGEQLQRFRHGLVHAIACLVAPPEAGLPIHVPLLCKLGESLHHIPKILGHLLTALLTARQVKLPPPGGDRWAALMSHSTVFLISLRTTLST